MAFFVVADIIAPFTQYVISETTRGNSRQIQITTTSVIFVSLTFTITCPGQKQRVIGIRGGYEGLLLGYEANNERNDKLNFDGATSSRVYLQISVLNLQEKVSSLQESSLQGISLHSVGSQTMFLVAGHGSDFLEGPGHLNKKCEPTFDVRLSEK